MNSFKLLLTTTTLHNKSNLFNNICCNEIINVNYDYHFKNLHEILNFAHCLN